MRDNKKQGRELENFAREFIKSNGIKIYQTKNSGAGQVKGDLRMEIEGQDYLIECKHHKKPDVIKAFMQASNDCHIETPVAITKLTEDDMHECNILFTISIQDLIILLEEVRGKSEETPEQRKVRKRMLEDERRKTRQAETRRKRNKERREWVKKKREENEI